MLKAYESVLGAGQRPPCNVHFIFEGEEECGGKVIFDILQRDAWRTEVDAVIVADMGYYAPGIPAVYTALRGLAYAEIHVRTAESDLHSGTYGGAAPNAIETMVRILSQLKDANGKIKIPGIYEAVKPPTKAELAGWKKLPFSEKRFLKEEVTGKGLTGIKGKTVFERTWALPTLEMHGIRGGFVAEGACKSVVGKKTVSVRAGGSIPVVTELAKGGAPVLLTGVGLPDDRIHAPNEKITLKQVWDGIEVFGRFLQGFGRQ